MDGYLVAISILAFLMSFAIGANDAANALATSYGSNALRLLWLVILGSVFEFIGAFWCSAHVAGGLVNGIIEPIDTLDEQVVEKMMLSTAIASFIFIIASSVFGMPISGTHTVVGALIGTGLAVVGSSNINWGNLGVIVASWFVAPILSILLSAALFLAVCALTLDHTRNDFKRRLLWLTVFTAVAFFLICVMFVKLISPHGSSLTAGDWTLLLLSPFVGVFLCRGILLFLVKPKQLDHGRGLKALFKFWSVIELEELFDEQIDAQEERSLLSE